VNRNIQDIREDYRFGSLIEDQVPNNPIELFKQWFEDAQSANISEPNAMTIATVNQDGKPSARIVLLKGYSEEGFIFYTNYDSRKGQNIAANPFVSIVFLWKEIERQVRIEGKIIKLSEERSTAYYRSRPKGSQIGAWVSPQSKVIKDRFELEEKYEKFAHKYQEVDHLPKPPNWGGYIIQPTMIEFWQGRSSRLHDRLRYNSLKNNWQIDRLAP
jgi:pyridoxamine 5'-phosphate oxidase